MKIIKTLLLLTMMSVVFYGCSSDDDASGATGPVAGSGQLLASVDGNAFESITAGTSATITSNSGTEFLQILAVNLDGQAFTITIIRPMIEENAYDFDSNLNITANATYTIVDSSTFQSESFAAPYNGSGDVGTITITELTADNIKGTFNCTMKNLNTNQEVTVTSGSFDLPVTRM